ncbi:MAG: hypothetical protein LBV13_05225 [Methanomassiliicoccaceae archaeon]|jgi:hypothetical protein|nr:hypothetical protein [Methanomassiliicoccaceae archaeon]
MGECKATVDSGVCKMITIIKAKTNADGYVELDIESDCPNILKLSWSLEPEFAFCVVEAPMNTTQVYKLASEDIPHAACPVPSAIIKAIEVAGDLGLKRDVHIKIE